MYHCSRPTWHAVECDDTPRGNLYHRVRGWWRRRRIARDDAGGPVPQLCPPWRTWKELEGEETMSYKYSDREREQMDDAMREANTQLENDMRRDRTVTTTGSNAAAAEVVFAELFARVQRGELMLTGCELERRPFDETIVMTVKLKPTIARPVASPADDGDVVAADSVDFYELDGVKYPQYRRPEPPKKPAKPERKPLPNGARELDLE